MNCRHEVFALAFAAGLTFSDDAQAQSVEPDSALVRILEEAPFDSHG
ncbi:MAG TPA: hypothetical protein VHG09_00795 [Longimicrobiales bacterium]|nr:hypothetical protein [Longimicrobiales bacterium]